VDSEIEDVRLDQLNHDEWSTVAGPEWNDVDALHAHLSQNTNIMEASLRLPWDALVPESAVVLDLGCGSGWLTGMLTKNPRVDKVIAWDLSPALLGEVLPGMVRLMGGDVDKVERVCGRFTPIMLDDHSIDLVVMSSAFHHEPDPDALLRELVRVVRPTGAIVLLNEVPYSVMWMLFASATMAIASAVNAMTTRVTIKKRGHIAADHVLYDDDLGDRAFTQSQWVRLFKRHDLDFMKVDTSLPSYPQSYRRRNPLESNLTHFILRPTVR